MKNILKLTGVSVLAIMTATNANAAGYTCEELIEYTSCNPGYYLNGGGDACPSGDTYYPNGVCIEEADMMVADFATKAECEAAWEGTSGTDYKWYTGPVCVSGGESGYYVEISAANEVAEKTCDECPAGSYCTGGTVGATTCPAGSYCATAGLKEPTNVCAKGSFSFAGATSCSICPAHVVKNSDGEYISVAATTDGLGATGFSACYIDSEVYFEDDKGKYHFNQKCSFNDGDEYGMAFYKSADGTCMDGYMYGEAASEYEEDGETYLTGCFALPSSEEDCMNADYSDGKVYWDGKQCICPHGFAIEYIGDLRC